MYLVVSMLGDGLGTFAEFSSRVKTIFDALFFTFSTVKGRRASSLTSTVSRLTNEYLQERVRRLCEDRGALTAEEAAAFIDVNLCDDFKRFMFVDLHGPKSAELLTWLPTFTHGRMRPGCCWGIESMMGKTHGNEDVCIDEEILRGLFGALASAEHVADEARKFRGSMTALRTAEAAAEAAEAAEAEAEAEVEAEVEAEEEAEAEAEAEEAEAEEEV